MNDYKHGGGVHQAAIELGRPVADLLDFSASINPLGMPDSVRLAAISSLDDSIHYPEIFAGSMVDALAAHHQLPPGHFLPGNGSTPLFSLLARTLQPRRVLLLRPAFSEYQRAFELAGVKIDPFDLTPEDGFALNPEKILERITAETDLLLFANPGNPSGSLIKPEIIIGLAQVLRERVTVAVDEAFIDFSPGDSVLQKVETEPNLYIFRSLTKFYAIPGLRAGYLAGPLEGICRLRERAEAWALSTPAIAAAKSALAATAYRAETLQSIPRLRNQLAEGLQSLGLKISPSAANFLLVRLQRPCADQVVLRLRQKGILMRSCSNFPPLDNHYLRIAVRNEGEQRILLTALAKLLLSLPPSEETS